MAISSQRTRAKLYRVVDLTRGTQGRLVKIEGVLHPDLDRVQQYGRFVAERSCAHKIFIADDTGREIRSIRP